MYGEGVAPKTGMIILRDFPEHIHFLVSLGVSNQSSWTQRLHGSSWLANCPCSESRQRGIHSAQEGLVYKIIFWKI